MNRKTAEQIENRLGPLTEAIVGEIYRAIPDPQGACGSVNSGKCNRDISYNLSHLARAISIDSPLLYSNYLTWAKILLHSLNCSEDALLTTLQIMRKVLNDFFSGETMAVIERFLSTALAELPNMPIEAPNFIAEDNPHSELAQTYLKLLLQGERARAAQLILSQVPERINIQDAYMHVFEPCQHELGRLWQTNKISVAQEHYCTAATQLIMSQLYPFIFNDNKNGRTLVAACIDNELHEIGIRMVADFFELEGWDTYYLGANTPTESIIQSIEQHDAEVLTISATMTYHLDGVSELIRKIRAAITADDLKILVGGYPFKHDPQLWKRVNADGCAPDASRAVLLANRLMGS